MRALPSSSESNTDTAVARYGDYHSAPCFQDFLGRSGLMLIIARCAFDLLEGLFVLINRLILLVTQWTLFCG